MRTKTIGRRQTNRQTEGAPFANRIGSIAAALGVATALAAQVPGQASAQGAIDQSYECLNTFAQIQFFSPVGQSFTPEASRISAIEVHLLQFNSPGTDTITMNLRSGSISGPILATGSQLLTPPPTERWVRYDLTPPVSVVPGDTYVIQLQATNASWGWAIYAPSQGGSSCPDYPGGAAILNTAAIPSFDARDWNFRTYSPCGDGTLDAGLGEECDLGAANGGTSCCSASCTIEDAGTVCRASTDLCDVADVCDGVTTACPNQLQPAGTVCRLSAGECGLDDTCSGASAACPDVHKPAGTACTADGQSCSLDQCNGAGACTHPAAAAGTVCRPTADACDLAESCNGFSLDCPADQVKPDSDFDGECNDTDPCTSTGSQNFASSKPKPKLLVGRINTDTVPGNDKLNVAGAFPLPSGVWFFQLTPQLHGVRVVVEAADDSRLVDVALPGGTYSTVTRRGWTLAASGKAWTYVDRSGSPVNGITKVVINDKNSATTPNRVQVTVSGARGTYPVVAGDQPLQAIVTLGNAAAATAGVCGESAFLPGECNFNGIGNTITCRK